jgi:hypothetical protein
MMTKYPLCSQVVNHDLEISTLGLSFVLQADHWSGGGRLALTCSGTLPPVQGAEAGHCAHN